MTGLSALAGEAATTAPRRGHAAAGLGIARWFARLSRWAAVPSDPAGLVVVRIAIGLSIAWFALATLTSTSLDADFVRPQMHLTYLGFDWVRPWPAPGMYAHFWVMLAAAVGVAVGLLYRASAVLMLLTFTHAFLIERSLYNNHYYLLVLLALLATVLPLHGCCSIDARLRPQVRRPTLPRWMLSLVRFQVGVVYCYGGFAKLNPDWLRGQPLRMWLKAQTDYPVIGGLFTDEWMVQVFVWSGLLIDLLAVPGLLWRRSRNVMFVLLTIFHLLNSTLFTIGVFPWLMIALTTVFLPPDWPRRVLRFKPCSIKAAAETVPAWTTRRTCGAMLLGMYVALQILLPMRPLLYPGDPSWTERGQLFSWRMMLRQKRSAVRMFVTDPQTGRRGVIDLHAHLNPRQLVAMSRDPDLILQVAHKLAELLRQHGIPDAEIRAQALSALNGRKPQLLIDPAVDLVQQRRSLRAYTWVMPLTEPYRHDDWEAPATGVDVAAAPAAR